MLFLLTGEIQTGKTRWLQNLISNLQAQHIPCYGVLAPGTWISSSGPYADQNGYEKTGIDNVLLPQNERISFARRQDLAQAEGAFDPNAQAAKAQLGWHISDAAIAHVNKHLASLPSTWAQASTPGLLIIDELGRLEINRNEGLTEGMALLQKGPTAQVPDALVVVRDYLVDAAEERFAHIWGETVRIYPDETAAELIQARFNA